MIGMGYQTNHDWNGGHQTWFPQLPGNQEFKKMPPGREKNGNLKKNHQNPGKMSFPGDK